MSLCQQACNNNNVKLENVLCVLELNSNLLSTAKITNHGYDVNKYAFNKYAAIVHNELDRIHVRNSYARCVLCKNIYKSREDCDSINE